MFRKNVAGQYLYFGLINASTGAALTGATVTGKRAIDGVAQASITGTITEEAAGQYKVALSQADTNGNNIGYLFTATSAIPVHIAVVTTAADPTDAVRFGLTAMPNANSASIGGLPTLGGAIPNNLAGASGGLPTCDTNNAVKVQTGTGTGQLDFTAGVVKANTTQWNSGTIPAANVTGVPIVDLKYTLGTISPATAGSVRADAVTGAVGSVTSGVSLNGGEHIFIAADVQSALTSQGYTTTRAGYLDTLNGLVQAIWDKATSAITTAGTIGKRIVDFITGDAFVRLGAPAGASHAADVAAVKSDTSAIEATVWNAAAASHTSTGTMGKKLNDLSAAGDPWSTALPGSYGAGTAGAILGGMSTLTVSIAAVKVKTDLLTFSVPNRVDANISQQGSGDAPFLAR